MAMRARDLHNLLQRAYIEKSLHEPIRDYLGMSGAGSCPREWYRRTIEPKQDKRLRWYAWTGYMHEENVLSLLGAEQKRREIVAKFDERYRGHTDHEMPDGTLIEIKSVGWDKYLKVLANGPVTANVAQCQAYMRHGGFSHAILVYVVRDIPWEGFDMVDEDVIPFVEIDVDRDERLMDELDEKAKYVLSCLDRGVLPRCECGYCR